MNDVIRQLAEKERIARQAIKTARQNLGKFKRIARGAARKQEYRNFETILTKDIDKSLADAISQATLRGIRRVQLQVKKARGLSFSVLDDVEGFLQNYLNVDLETIQRELETDALIALKGAGESVERALRSTIARIVEEDMTIRDGIKAVESTLARVGVEEQSAHLIETVVRTQTAIAYSAGKWKGYQAQPVQEILWGYTYTAILDNRTRPSHEAQDGVTLPKDDVFWRTWWPPNGYNCRCDVIPLFDESRIKRSDAAVTPDHGFAFNPGEVI